MPSRREYRRVVVVAALLSLGVAIIVALAIGGVLGQRLDSPTAPSVTLALSSGDPISLPADARGRVVVINFFASWCPPCRDEAPALREVWRQIRDSSSVVMVGVVYRDDGSSARGYLKDYDLGFPVAEDSEGSIAEAFRVAGIPKTFVIAPGGAIVLSHFGAINAETLLAAIEEAQGRTQ